MTSTWRDKVLDRLKRNIDFIPAVVFAGLTIGLAYEGALKYLDKANTRELMLQRYAETRPVTRELHQEAIRDADNLIGRQTSASIDIYAAGACGTMALYTLLSQLKKKKDEEED